MDGGSAADRPKIGDAVLPEQAERRRVQPDGYRKQPMRPGQNKRMRNRPTNNRRGPNPLTRPYESNGPDVKIRGNAHHVAEKYLQLARDAHTGGDPVAAENYLQHAEHYFRLIASAQAAQALAQSGQSRPAGEGDADDPDDETDFGGLSDRFASPSEKSGGYFQQQQYGPQTQSAAAPNAPQPYIERAPFEADRQVQREQGGFPVRHDRQPNRFPDRGSRPDRPFGERSEGYRDNRHNRDGRPREFHPYRDPSTQPVREGGVESVESAGLPSFITTGSRSIASEQGEGQPMPPGETPVANDGSNMGMVSREATAEGRFPGRGRRRRLRSPYGFNDGGPGDSENSEPIGSHEPPISD